MPSRRPDAVHVVHVAAFAQRHRLPRPLFATPVRAGFPSPAEDYVDRVLDLNDLVVRHPAATFFVRVAGESMVEAGIRSGDVLVVDRALEAGEGKVVVAILDGELTVKRVGRRGGRLVLLPANDAFPPIEVGEEQELLVWGVVTHVIHAVR